jgi:membrane protein DedA with SNARE-associated domain
VSPTATVAFILADTHKQLPGVFNSLEPTLRHYGYLAVGGILFLEDFGVPLPGETMLIAASLYAGTGSLNIWLVGLVAVVGAVLGDNVGFAIGHFGGRKLIDRFGKYVLMTPERLDKVEAFFRKHGTRVVVIARFVEGLRQANGLIAGTVGMRWPKFLAANVVGAVGWVAFWASLGYFAGNHVETISKYFTYFAIGLVVLVVLVVSRHLIAHRRKRTAEAG